MDSFLKFKKKKEEVKEAKIQPGSRIKVIKGNHKGLIGHIKYIKEEKWVYILTCMNELKTTKIPIEYVILDIP